MNIKKTKVSIIVPVYNVEKYLKRCLNSLVNQTLTDIEIICIDDGSTDNSLKILHQYLLKDPRIKVITQQNAGQSVARNIGVENSTGEYLCFVDSDDWIDLDFCEKLYEAAVRTGSDISIGGMVRLHLFRKKYHLKFDNEIVISDNNLKFSTLDIPDKSYSCGRLYNREFYLNTGLSFEQGRVFEDVIFTPLIVLKSKLIVVVPNTNYYYWRRFSSTVTSKKSKSVADRIYALNKANEIMQSNGIILDHKEITTRMKILGVTLYKTRTKHGKTNHYLFNIIKW